MFLPRELVSVLPNSAHLYNQTHISTWLHPGSETLDAFARRSMGKFWTLGEFSPDYMGIRK